MVQMTPSDQAIVKAIPGNKSCCDCGMKSPQWASVSFGNVFCLECSGVHRSLGVHISFVRSIAMDSWTEKQMTLMKLGGNDNCNQYLKNKGIDSRTPIKQKYESDHAQLYKEILKARAEGRPEPTSLPPPKKKTPYQSASAPSSMNRPMMGGGGGGGGVASGSTDANGMERMTGETEQQYVARQTRLREEARARMASKFGGSGGRMGGVGSNPNYNPSASGMDDVMGSVTSVFSTGLSLVGGAASSVNNFVQDDNTKASISNIGSTATGYAGSFWSSISSAANDVASSITQPDGDDDGLAALQREFSSNKPTQSKYGGFGSDSKPGGGNSNWNSQPNSGAMGGRGNMSGAMPPAVGGTLQEAPGMPGEDRNGMERLSGETDEQYVARQTRLREEAKARMAAKFGSGGLSSASSSASPYRPAAAPSSGNYSAASSSPYNSAPSSGNFGSGIAAAPASGGMQFSVAPRSGGITPPRKNSKDSLSGDDFFSSFGT